MQKYKLSQIVWAKIKGYSWWPAMVQKYFKKSNEYSLIFYGNSPFFSKLTEDNIKDYEEYYYEFSAKKTSGLKTAIEEANKDVVELNKSNTLNINNTNMNLTNKGFSQSQIRFNDYIEKNCEELNNYSNFINDNNEAMITTILSNITLDNNIKINSNLDINDDNLDNIENINDIEYDNLNKSFVKEDSFIISELGEIKDDPNNVSEVSEIDSAEEFYFNSNLKLDKVNKSNKNEGINEISDTNTHTILNLISKNDKSYVKDETNEETILKLTNNSIYDEDTFKLDDIVFMLNFILIQIRSNLLTNEDLIHKFKVEIIMILKQLIDFKEKDSKVLYNVTIYSFN